MSHFGGDMFSLLTSFRSTVADPETDENTLAKYKAKNAIRLAISGESGERPEGSPQIEFSGVTRTYAGARGSATTALEDISFAVSPGEFVCIVGPSGCGKSTLLHLAAGLDRPTEGEVRVAGVPVKAPGTDRILLFQELGLFPWLTAGENVEFGLKMVGVAGKERRERAQHYLRMVHLSKFRDSQVHELSGGMKQRVALARSLAMRPKVLLMDEPFAALDAQTRDLLHDELERLWQETGATIVFVTHNVREAVRLGDRVMLMTFRPGQIKRQFRIQLPRPRHIEDPDVARSSKEILGHLREEIQRSMNAEYSHEEV